MDDALQEFKNGKPTSAGSAGLDGLIGGGYRPGKMVLYYGPSGSGKTQVAMQAALVGAMAGKRVLFLDTEGTFRPERLEEMAEARGLALGGSLERIIYLRCESFQEQAEAVREMDARTRTRGTEFVVVDTLTRNFTVSMPGMSNTTSRQSALSVHLSEMGRDAFLRHRAYVLTNRVTFGANGVVGIGGLTVQDMVHKTVSLEREGGTLRARLAGGGAVSLTIGKKGVD